MPSSITYSGLPLSIRFASALCCVSALAVGCAVPEEEVVPDLPASMVVGTGANGSEGFLAVEDGEDAILARGGQGGFHLWTNPKIRGAEGTVYLDREARLVSDGTLVLRGIRLVIDLPEETMGDWWHPEQAVPSFMCPTPIGVTVYDQEIEFVFRMLSEDEELLAEDRLRVVARCDESDLEFCHEVCGG